MLLMRVESNHGLTPTVCRWLIFGCALISIVSGGYGGGSSSQIQPTVKVGTKSAAASFVGMNTLRITLPAGITSGPQRLMIANPDGETIAVDGAINLN